MTTTASPDPGSRTAGERRAAATEQLEAAIATINALFDRVGDLHAARERLTVIAPLGAGEDPLRDAETLLDAAAQLSEALEAVRVAAVVAVEHRSRNDLARDLGTRTATLFPRRPKTATDASSRKSLASGSQRPPMPSSTTSEPGPESTPGSDGGQRADVLEPSAG